MNRWNLPWMQTDDDRADKQDVLISVNGSAMTVAPGGADLGMTVSNLEVDFNEIDVVQFQVRTKNADGSKVSLSDVKSFSAANPTELGKATPLDAEFVGVV